MPPAHPAPWTDAEVQAFWSRPSHGDRWVPFVVVLAGVVTLAVIVILAGQAWTQAARLDRLAARSEIGAVLGGIGAVALLATVWLSRYDDVSLWARAAVGLVCVDIALAAGAWFLSHRLQPSKDGLLPLWSALPAPAIAFGAGLLLFVLATIHVRVRRLVYAPGWLRGTVVFALAYLLLLGLWLPVVVPEHPHEWFDAIDLAHVRPFATSIPPALAALAVAMVTVTRRAWLRKLVPVGGVLVGLLLVGAMTARTDTTRNALLIYANYIHVLFAAAWFALSSLAALAWTHGRVLRANRVDTQRPAPWVQRGVVECEGEAEVVGAWHVDGWLAGLRTSLRGFTLRSARGDLLLVPPGSRLVAAVPTSTVGAAHDEPQAALRAGDEVVVSGFVASEGEGPYRTAGLAVPGADGLVVTAPRGRDEPAGRDVVLLLYRPCVLFLVAVALAALPGVVGDEEEAPFYVHDNLDER